MRRAVITALLAVSAGACPVYGGMPYPHRVAPVKQDQEVVGCEACHAADMTLERNKVETCTRCHGGTPHAGAAEHLRASAAGVSRLLEAARSPEVTLPVAEDGRMYCGTCHLFHDPALFAEEPVLRVPRPSEPMPARAVRESLAEQWQRVASAHGNSDPGARFSGRVVKALRLAVDNGALCRHCHAEGP